MHGNILALARQFNGLLNGLVQRLPLRNAEIRDRQVDGLEAFGPIQLPQLAPRSRSRLSDQGRRRHLLWN
jgi:hypothetical protein